jgi:formyltetrahydrofolate synthetase
VKVTYKRSDDGGYWQVSAGGRTKTFTTTDLEALAKAHPALAAVLATEAANGQTGSVDVTDGDSI